MHGQVLDANTGGPLWLAHAVIVDPDGTIVAGAVTDPNGWFNLPNATNRAVLVSHVGYQSTAFIPAGASPYTVQLSPGVDLGEVEVIYEPYGTGGGGAGADDGNGNGLVDIGVDVFNRLFAWVPWVVGGVVVWLATRRRS